MVANLDPKAKVHVEMFQVLSDFPSMNPQTVRRILAQAPPLEVELAPLAKVEDRLIPVDQGEEIKIRIYTPEGQGPFPIFVYYHGGGWVIGDIEMTDASCRLIANRTGRIVVSVNYRLAPEYKFPIPVEDGYTALQWVSENAAAIHGNASNIAVGGDSAGGNLAAVVAMKARDQNGPAIAAQVLIYPVTNLDYDTGSYEEFQKGFGLDRDLMIWFGDHYIRSEEDKKNKYLAPLLADDLSNLPPAFVITAENDVLRDEGLAYAKRLQEAGVPVESICEEGLVHGYFSNLLVFPERIEATISKMAQFLNRTIQQPHFDAVVIGAGFSGLYMLHRLREAGLSVRVYEAGDGVGGVWYWNRYPGARCDSESIYYNYTFSDELLQEWTWSSRYPEQPEILRYLNYVADKFDLRPDIQFHTRVTAAHYDEENNRWKLRMEDGTSATATYFISGVGCLSAANIPTFKGLDRFKGEWYHTGHWPHEKVDFKGKRVGVIGNGSSGVQSIPVIAQEADHLIVFQRTPQYTIPARNHPYDPEFIRQTKENYPDIRQKMKESWGGFPIMPSMRSALEDTQEVRQEVYETAWEKGGFFLSYTYRDLTMDEAANETVADFIRSKIRQTVQKPDVAEKLLPSYYFGTKRPILDTHYFETYNRENVTLVDVKAAPIEEITEKGLRTTEAEYELDILVFATGYDGITGPLLKIDIRGRDGLTLKEKWAEGANVQTYLGIANAGFPNFFMITGPESPSVLANMPLAIEQHVEWIADCIEYLRDRGVDTIEATAEAENAWSKHCREVADTTLYPKADSWYTGANIAGKPRSFLIYLGGFGVYRQICDGVAAKDYDGFSLMTTRETVS